jgi:competence protein ComGC
LRGEKNKMRYAQNVGWKITNSKHGMTLVQTIILLALIAIIAVLTIPKLREEIYVRKADSDVVEVAEACKKYWKWEGQYCTDFNQLIVKGYLKEIPNNPWGGKYILKPEKHKVGIPKDEEKVPEKYRFGGIAEISRVYKEGANLW